MLKSMYDDLSPQMKAAAVVGGSLVLLGGGGFVVSVLGSKPQPLKRGDEKRLSRRKSTGFQTKTVLDLAAALKDDADNREWGVDTGVGATALWIASVRYREKFEKPPTFVDPYAERFLRDGKGHEVSDAIAKKLHHFMFMDETGQNFDSSLTLKYLFPPLGRRHVERMKTAPVDPKRIADPGRDCVRQGIRLRTAFLDKQIGDAFAPGSPIKQFVCLALGCDCRCLRLDCVAKPGIKTWCIDQGAVIDAFKAACPELKKRPDITMMAIKFGEELWWEKILAAGFDPKVPSFFLCEGLVMYLEDAENEELFREIGKLMAPGSRIAGDYINKGWLINPMVQPMQDQLRTYRAPWTFGTWNSLTWARRLRRHGIKVTQDTNSVQADSLFGKVKMALINYAGVWIPLYRIYTGVKC